MGGGRRPFSANTVRSVGALLPHDVLAKAVAGEALEGLTEADYGLDEGVLFRDAVSDAWNEANALWWRFVRELRVTPAGDATAMSVTRERWLLPLLDLLGFDDVAFHGSINVAGTDYPISHLHKGTVLHLMGVRVDLDGRVAGVPGAARLSPHSLVQQLLNRSNDHLWAIVSNGLRLRILRDSVSLTRQAYVEFDLEAMFNGEIFADFVLLYRVAHATRFEADRREDCLLERWITAAREDGIRALDRLRAGVEAAIMTLGTGFLKHRYNEAFRHAVDKGEISEHEVYRHLLRLVYRLLFLFVAEDRDVLHTPDATPEQRDRYLRYYSTGRLRELAARTGTAGHGDLWQSLRALMVVLGRDHGEPLLALPALGSFLWASDSIGALIDAGLDNIDLLTALQRLAYVEDEGNLRRIDFASLGPEELGSIYEALLELHPAIDDDRNFLLGVAAGSERKTTGSYYTPISLIAELLDSALDPVLDEAAAADDPEEAILALNVVDPAAGSGHFLVAAAHRIGKRLAEARTGEPEPPLDAYRAAVRDVIGNCIYAVDFNELAVELCKVNLWLEAIQPGKPLSFLDHHVVCGNALIGASPDAITGGIPNEAFTALTGDDTEVVNALKRRNRQERTGQGTIDEGEVEPGRLDDEIAALETLDDYDLERVRAKEQLRNKWQASDAHVHASLVADAWCAAFTIPKKHGTPALTEATFRRLRDQNQIAPELESEIHRQAEIYRYFHWHLGFPQVFTAAPDGARTGGFDVILGNPPWDHVELKEQEFFAARDAEIAEAAGARRKTLIAELVASDKPLGREYMAAKRRLDGMRHFAARSGLYPLCGRGRIKTEPLFAEAGRDRLAGTGRLGMILPTGIATDSTTQHFFKDLVVTGSIASLYDFENRKRLFEAVDPRQNFCLLTLVGRDDPQSAVDFAFFAHQPADLQRPNVRFSLAPEEIALLNPNTGTCPVFRGRRDAEITLGVYKRVPVLIREGDADENPWGIKFMQGLFNMTSDSHLFHTRDELESQGWVLNGNAFERGGQRMLPLYQGMMATFYNHRAADVVRSATATRRQNQPSYLSDGDLADPCRLVIPAWWVETHDIPAGMPAWFVGFSSITSPTNERSMIAYPIPRVGVGNSIPLMLVDDGAPLLAMLCSFPFDYALRQKLVGENVNYYLVKQLPALSPDSLACTAPWDVSQSIRSWIIERVGELVFTAIDMSGFSQQYNLGPEPYRWNPARRDLLRAELDAAFFHLYGIARDDLDYIMETFPIVKRKDIAAHGEYRTKRLILEIFDAMAEAERSNAPYVSPLDKVGME